MSRAAQWSNTRYMSSTDSEYLASRFIVYCGPRSSPSLEEPPERYRAAISRSWSLTALAPAATQWSTRVVASSTSPWWLLPISPITRAGRPSPIVWRPIVRVRGTGEAIATMRPRSSSTGMRSTPGRARASMRSIDVPSRTDTNDVRAASAAGASRSGAVCAVSQRRTSPSDREPVTTPWASARNTTRARLASMRRSASCTVASASTR